MLTIKNLVDDKVRVPFDWESASPGPRSFKSHVKYILRVLDPSKKGQGVDSNQMFPWDASPSWTSEQFDGLGNENLYIRVSFVIRDTSEETPAPTITVRVDGGFSDIMDCF